MKATQMKLSAEIPLSICSPDDGARLYDVIRSMYPHDNVRVTERNFHTDSQHVMRYEVEISRTLSS